MKQFLFLTMLLGASFLTISAQTNRWLGAGANTNWNTIANWSLNTVPTAANDVVIPTGSTVVINVVSNMKSIVVQGNANLTITRALNFINPSSFEANTTIIFSDGSLSGGGTVVNNGTINVTGTANKYLYDNTVLNNAGTINLGGSGQLYVTNGTINNLANGIIDMQVANANISYSGGTIHKLNNYGLLKKTGGAGVVSISAELHNDGGTIDVQTGELTLGNSLIKLTNGTYNVSAGAALNFNNTVTCAGSLIGNLSGPINWNGTVAVPASASFNFTGNTGVHWNDGSLRSGGALTNMSKITLLTTNNKYLYDNTILNNDALINYESTGLLYVTDGTINNQVGGLIDLKSDGNSISYSGGSTHILNNYGEIKRSNTSGASSIQIVLNNNNGKISVESGSLIFNSLAKNLTNGIYNVSENSELTWSTSIFCAGTLTGVLNGGILWNNAVNVPETTTATFNFSGNIGVLWQDGSLTGGGTLVNQSELTLISTANKYFYEDTLLNNEGIINYESNGLLYLTNGTLNNQIDGLIYLIANGSNISYSGGVTHVLNNYGTIECNVGAGSTSTIVSTLNNLDGTINVVSGTLNLASLAKNLTNGIYNVAAGSSLGWNSQIYCAGILTGLLTGEILWNAEVNIPNTTTATFNFTGPTGVNWSNGSLAGGGNLINQSKITLISTNNKYVYTSTKLNNQGIFNYESTGLLYLTDGIFNNEASGIIDLKSDGNNISYSGGTVHILNNSGLIKRSLTSGISSIGVVLNNNDGVISVESGSLNFVNLPKNLTDGTYNVVNGSSLRWLGQVICAGTLTGALNGEIFWNNEVNVPLATSATFDFSGTTGVNWNDGSLRGGGTLNNKSEITLISTNNKYFYDNTVLNNDGFLNLEGVGLLYITDGILNNQLTGVLDLKTDTAQISYSGGNLHVVNNFGLIKKSLGSGSNTFQTTTTNSGIIDVQVGTINFVNGQVFNNSIDGIIKGVGTIDLPASATFTNDGTFAPGASPGILTVLGDYKSSATSVLDIELDGLTQGTQYDLLAITGTNVIFEGQVNVSLGFNANVGDTFTISTVSGVIATKNLVSPIYADYGCKNYRFDISYPNDKEVLLTIASKADIIAPDVIAQDITVQLNSSGTVTIAASQINNGSTDNCTLPENLILNLDTTNFSCTNLGINTVQLTVIDEAGNSSNATANVTVEDSISPIIICLDDKTVTGGINFVIPDYYGENFVNVSDNCGVTSVVQDPVPGTEVGSGSTTVTLTAYDASGNTATCTFVIDVTLGVDTVALVDTNISVYPNPVSNQFTLKNASGMPLISVTISDIKGSIIKEIDLKDMTESKIISMDDYPTGVYFLKINAASQMLVKRLVKL